MRRTTLFMLCATLMCSPVSRADKVGGFGAMYVDGTAPGLAQETQGVTHTSSETEFVFDYKKGNLTIPYKQITSLEYGETAGRRTNWAMTGQWYLGLTKHRRHYLTVGYLDESQKQQTAVFEIGKDRIWATLYNLQKKTGKKLEYLDDESRKEVERLRP